MDRDALRDLRDYLATLQAEIVQMISQAWSWLSAAFCLPGDFVVTWLASSAPGLADALGMSEQAYGSGYVVAFSAVAWLSAALLVKAVYNLARGFLQRMVFLAREFAATVSYWLRIVRMRMTVPLRRMKQRLQGRKVEYSEEIEIDDLQMSIMRAHCSLAPGHVLTAVDVSGEFGVRPLQAQHALDSLKKLQLLEVSFGTTDGFPGYHLTQPGKIFLTTCGRMEVPGRS